MSLQNFVEIIIFLVIPTIVIGFYFPKKLVEHAAGKKIGRKPILFGGGFLALVILFLFADIFLAFANPSLASLDVGFTFLLIIPFFVASINLVIRQIIAHFQLKREKIILNLGRIDKTLAILSLVMFLLNGLLLFRNNSYNGRFTLAFIFLVGAYVTFIAFWFIFYFSRVYLTESGLAHTLFRLKWERMTSYQWGQVGGDTIPLWIKGGRETKVNIPVDQRAEVEALFEARQVQRLAPVGSGMPPWKKDMPDYQIEFRETMDTIKARREARRPKPIVAPLKKRLAALILDGIILLLPMFYFYYIFLGEWAYDLGPYGRILTYAIIIAYLGYSNSGRRKGQTFGQKSVAIAVVDRDYNYLSLNKAFRRALIFCLFLILFQWQLPLLDNHIVTALSWAIIAGMGLSLLYAYVFNDITRQGLHDLLVGSYVVVWPPI